MTEERVLHFAELARVTLTTIDVEAVEGVHFEVAHKSRHVHLEKVLQNAEVGFQCGTLRLVQAGVDGCIDLCVNDVCKVFDKAENWGLGQAR